MTIDSVTAEVRLRGLWRFRLRLWCYYVAVGLGLLNGYDAARRIERAVERLGYEMRAGHRGRWRRIDRPSPSGSA